MATAVDEKIKRLEELLKQEKARKRKQDAARRFAEAKAKRAEDTRRKILLGALLLEQSKVDEQLNRYCLSLLNKKLTKNADRELFKLAPIKPTSTSTSTQDKI